MKCSIVFILLAVLLTSLAGPVLAQDLLNESEAINATNETITVDIAPVNEAAPPLIETAESDTEAQDSSSRFQQLSTYVKEAPMVLGKNVAQEFIDVSQTINTGTVFAREAGASTPSVKVSITKVNTGEDKYVQVTNQAVGSWEITGWTLASAENTTFTFPALTLEEEGFVRVHEGKGVSSESEIYTNSSAPLWIDNLVSLLDAEGNIVSTYDVSAMPVSDGWVDPLANQIQY